MAPVNVGDPVNIALGAVALSVAVVFGHVIYNLFFHPLRNYPGPFLWRASNIPGAYWSYREQLPFKVAELHRQYGEVVRITPNELAYIGPEAWNDIYGHRKNGVPEFPKCKSFYQPSGKRAHNIIFSDREEHTAIRRALSHGFSDRSMREQEPTIVWYVNLLVQRLHERTTGANGGALDMREWFNYTTFDIIGELGFGSSFDCLAQSDYHPWIRAITDNFRSDTILRALQQVGMPTVVSLLLEKFKAKDSRKEHYSLMTEKLSQRMEITPKRPDFMGGLITGKEKLGLGFGELVENANVLLVAGSETTATLLSGCLFLLTTNRDKLEKVVEEVRTSFASDEEITLQSASRLSYMMACLNESLRRYPPVPSGLPRVVPKGGGQVAGRFVPEGTKVSVWQWSSNHSEQYWTDPMSFVPERFLGEERFKNDRSDAMQPFSAGPRNCLGKNLAYYEMRLILAKILWNFDATLEDDSRGWLKGQPANTLWVKPGLNIRFKPAQKS